MRIGVTLPSRTGPMKKVFEYAARAEAAGMYSAWDYEVYRNPFAMHVGTALATERVRLGTGLAQAFSRSPFEAANAAADVDEASGGRLIFGVGTGVPEWLQAFHSTDGSRPLGRLSEYLDVLRLSWRYLKTGEPSEPYEGKHYSFFTPPGENPWGLRDMPRTEIPVYLAAMGPKLLELAGEKADGWVGYFATKRFMSEYVIPQITAGAARAGRDVADLDLVAETICCVHPDRDVALARARRQVGFYVVHPVSDRVVEMHGLMDQVNELRMNFAQEGLAAFEKTDERIVETLSISGTPDEARQRLADYEDSGITHIALHTPYVPPFTPEESEDAFDNILDAFGEVARLSWQGEGAAVSAAS